MLVILVIAVTVVLTSVTTVDAVMQVLLQAFLSCKITSLQASHRETLGMLGMLGPCNASYFRITNWRRTLGNKDPKGFAIMIVLVIPSYK